MHAIMPCVAASSSSDAGRLPLAVPTFTIPTRPLHIAADNLQAALHIQVINPAKDKPVATSPVPLKRERRARFTQDDLVLANQAALLKHIKTLDRLEALGMLEGRTPRPLQEDMVLDWWTWSSLQYGRFLNRIDTLGILEGTKTPPAQVDLALAGLSMPSSLQCARTINKLDDLERQGDKGSGDDSIVLAESETSSLKRARTINKRAGLDILKRRESRKARFFGGQILQAHLRP